MKLTEAELQNKCLSEMTPEEIKYLGITEKTAGAHIDFPAPSEKFYE